MNDNRLTPPHAGVFLSNSAYRLRSLLIVLLMALMLAVSSRSHAGNAFLSCEENTVDAIYVCFLIADDGVSLTQAVWGASAPLFLNNTLFGPEVASANFVCSGETPGGGLWVNYATADGMQGSASMSAQCPQSGGGGGGGIVITPGGDDGPPDEDPSDPCDENPDSEECNQQPFGHDNGVQG